VTTGIFWSFEFVAVPFEDAVKGVGPGGNFLPPSVLTVVVVLEGSTLRAVVDSDIAPDFDFGFGFACIPVYSLKEIWIQM
jgi:hypothetical protein